MRASETGPTPQPVKKVDEKTQPGTPLGEGPEVPTDEHAALGDTEERTDENAVPDEKEPAAGA